MIGEKIKIGFDGSEVKRGLAGIMGGFGKLGRGIGRATRQVGIGAARRMGSDLFGFIVSGLKAIPNELQSMTMLNKELEVMGKSTGIAADKYLALREAIAKTTGRSPEDAGDFLRDVSERLGEGMADFDSTPRKAMRELGLRAHELKGKNIEEQMAMIASKFTDFKNEKGPEAAMFQINELLGEVGKQMIPLFLNYEKGMESASAKTKGLAEQIKSTGGELETMLDIRMALSRKFSQLSLGVLKAFSVNGGLGSISREIDALPIAEWSRSIASELKKIKDMGPFDWIKEKLDTVEDWLSDAIAQGISKGISAGISDIMPSFSIKDLFNTKKKGSGESGGFDFNKGNNWIKDKLGVGGVDSKKIENNTARTNDLLERISENGITGVYA